MKKKHLIELRTFFSEHLLRQKLSKQKKSEIESYIDILDQALKQKDPVQYLRYLLPAAQVAELIKLGLDFFKSG